MSGTISPQALERAMSVLMQERERLAAIDPTIEEDWQLYQDCLDGEAGNALQVIERLIGTSIDADGLAEMVKARKMDLATRQARFEKRSETMRAIALSAMEALNLRRLERPEWSAFVGARPAQLILDEEALPDKWFRVKKEAERALIRRALSDGEEIPGAVLGNSSTRLTIRTR
jgi:hypothetical protein